MQLESVRPPNQLWRQTCQRPAALPITACEMNCFHYASIAIQPRDDHVAISLKLPNTTMRPLPSRHHHYDYRVAASPHAIPASVPPPRARRPSTRPPLHHSVRPTPPLILFSTDPCVVPARVGPPAHHLGTAQPACWRMTCAIARWKPAMVVRRVSYSRRSQKPIPHHSALESTSSPPLLLRMPSDRRRASGEDGMLSQTRGRGFLACVGFVVDRHIVHAPFRDDEST